MHNMFPEITSLLVGKAQAKESGEIDGNIATQNKKLQVRLSEVYQGLLIHKQFKEKPGSQCGYGNKFENLKVREESLCRKEGAYEIESKVLERDTSLVDLGSAQIEIKNQALGESAVSCLSPIAVEGSNGRKEKQNSVTHKRGIDPKVVDMGIQENIASCGEDLEVMYVRSSDNKDSEKLDGIAGECAAREEADYYARTLNFGSAVSTSAEKCREVVIARGKNTSLVHSTHMENGPAAGVDSPSCIIIEKEVGEIGSDTISKLQKQDSHICCQICKKHFDNLQGYEKLHSTGRPFICDVCSIDFKKEQLLLSRQSFYKKERPFTCEICGKTFKRSDTLGIHRRTHLGLKCYKCEVCLKSYVSKFVLKRHQVVHSNERPFACDLCDRKFRLKYDLTLHKRRHVDDKPFACKECGKKFTNSGHVATHMLIHKNQRSFICCECGKGFLRKEHLERHFSNVHVGDRNYACNTCEKRFKRLEVLKAHLLTHSGKGKFVCKYCDKMYSTKWNLQAHKMSRHKES